MAENTVPLKGIALDAAAAVMNRAAQNVFNIEIDSEAGRDNRMAILHVVSAGLDLYQMQRRLGMLVAEASTAYAANMAALEAHLRSVGLTDSEINDLTNKYRDLPPDPA